MYCQNCGNPLPEAEAVTEIEAEGATDQAEIYASSDVRIAEINAAKEVKLAQIAAGIIDAERDTDLARAEGKAEALEEVINPAPPEDAEPTPIVVEAPDGGDDGADGNPPPVSEDTAPPPSGKSSGAGWYS